MKVIKIKARQTTANYKIPEFMKVHYSYDLPSYSTVIGMIHMACGFDRYVDMDISIQTKYCSKQFTQVYFYEFAPGITRKDYLEKYNLIVENGNNRTGVNRTFRKVELLYDVEHIFHVKVEESMIEKIRDGILKPKVFLSLGRSEDLLVIEDVKIVDVQEKSLSSYNLKYNAYVPYEFLKDNEDVGTVYNINKKYHIDEKTKLRIWDDVAKVVIFNKNDVLNGKFYIDNDDDIVFLR